VEQTVRNIHEVLKQKEADCARLRHEIEALQVVVPLLDEQAVTDRASLLNEESAEAEPSMRDAEEREVRTAEAGSPTEIDVERKGPLAASLGETSWWRRQTSR
jgi:hypothetical protein